MIRPNSRGPAARRPPGRRPTDHRPSPALHARVAVPARTPAGPLARDDRTARVEALLFLADEPLTARRLATLAGLRDTAEARSVVRRLRELLDADGTSFQVEEIAGGYQLLTRPQFRPWLGRLRRGAELRLSPAALETLAVVAWRQPVMRADVEAVRGVQCGELLQQLMDRGLVRIAGRHDSLGRPLLYATTANFLRVFGLNNLKDLPQVDQLRPPG